MDNHHNATFIVLSTDGADCIVGIAENGETALGTFESLEWVARHISQNVRECVDGDRPLIIAVGKNKKRATAGEVFLEAFALDIVRATLATFPAEVSVEYNSVTSLGNYFHPRVVSTPLPWATKSTPVGRRVHALLDELAFTDEGLTFIPKGRTHAAG